MITLTLRQAESLVKNYDTVTGWVRDHAELCETQEHLDKVDEAARRAGTVIDIVSDQVKSTILRAMNSVTSEKP